MLVAQYFNAFILFSFAGWICECVFCRIRYKHWVNRGFLFGPVCPIYGFAVVIAMIRFGLLSGPENRYSSPVWLVFIICALISAFLEVITSLLLERLFHAFWWDYSGLPLNFQGRVCLPATLGYGAAGVIIVRLILPFLASLPLEAHPNLNEFPALFFMLLFGIDITLTVSSLNDMLERIEKIQVLFDKRMQEGYEFAVSGPVAMVNAAKNSAIVAKRELYVNAVEFMRSVSSKDRHHLMNIRAFKGASNRTAAEKILELFRRIYMTDTIGKNASVTNASGEKTAVTNASVTNASVTNVSGINTAVTNTSGENISGTNASVTNASGSKTSRINASGTDK